MNGLPNLDDALYMRGAVNRKLEEAIPIIGQSAINQALKEKKVYTSKKLRESVFNAYTTGIRENKPLLLETKNRTDESQGRFYPVESNRDITEILEKDYNLKKLPKGVFNKKQTTPLWTGKGKKKIPYGVQKAMEIKRKLTFTAKDTIFRVERNKPKKYEGGFDKDVIKSFIADGDEEVFKYSEKETERLVPVFKNIVEKGPSIEEIPNIDKNPFYDDNYNKAINHDFIKLCLAEAKKGRDEYVEKYGEFPELDKGIEKLEEKKREFEKVPLFDFNLVDSEEELVIDDSYVRDFSDEDKGKEDKEDK